MKNMTNEYFFNEIMSQNLNTKEQIIMSLEKMSKICKDIDLLMDDNNNLYYCVDAKKISQQNLEIETLHELNQSGWILSKDKKFLNLYV